MSQYSLPIPNGAGSAVRANINSALEAIYTNHSGPTAPSGPKTWQIWTDTSVTPPVERQWNGAAWVERSSELRVAVNNSNYIVGGAGNRIIGMTSLSAHRTITLPPANSRGGQRISIQDESGNASPSAQIVIQRAGSDTISGLVSVAIVAPYGSITLVSDGGSKWIPQRPGTRRQEFLASGTWLCPTFVTLVKVTVVGGGGSGSCANSGNPAGGGGGGIVVKTVVVVPGAAYPITVGAGGGGSWNNYPGNSGGSSSFGTLATALGGGGATKDYVGTDGVYSDANGVAGNQLAGAGGANSAFAITGGGAYSGGASWGPGGAGGTPRYQNGNPGLPNTGGGGSGCIDATSGAGGSGIVIVEWLE